ncbi:unnamed protein product [Allacma fusca]|uniref:Dipeptidase n=1 Tax=Allacma fusca TaxID=39272 RepID=A0A8J2NXF2_9HEXA|nr:unnamed protein product [Allacma fusca]
MQKRTLIIIGASALIVATIIVTVSVLVTRSDSNVELTLEEKVHQILEDSPVIDGHNDLPWNIRRLAYNDLRRVNFSEDLTQNAIWGKDDSTHTDIPRLRKGHVGAQFWVAYTSCTSQFKDSVEQTLEQIDVIKRLVDKYPEDLQFATSADDIENAIANKKIASLVAVEGGHSMQFSFGILRNLYAMGARYMTLTHSCNTPWADASPVDAKNPILLPESDGLSEYGLRIVKEMNRLGMMVDLSHVSQRTMEKALNHSVAPVIFSHSSARAICDHHRNVPDSVLEQVRKTNSLVMVNFYNGFIRCDGQRANISDVVEHIEHIRGVTGPDHIGIGGDFDGVDSVPEGLEDVSKYPDLIKALLETGNWTDEDLKKLSGQNLIRVFRAVEEVRDSLKGQEPEQDAIKAEELEKYKVNLTCITAKFERLQPQQLLKTRREAPAELQLREL